MPGHYARTLFFQKNFTDFIAKFSRKKLNLPNLSGERSYEIFEKLREILSLFYTQAWLIIILIPSLTENSSV
jgi:hypothetical protein